LRNEPVSKNKNLFSFYLFKEKTSLSQNQVLSMILPKIQSAENKRKGALPKN
jgi:hypothetical protein